MKRILFGSDFHGNKVRYQAFFSSKVDVFILGGDLFSIEGDFRQIYSNQIRFGNDFLRPLLESQRDKEIYLMPGNTDVAAHLFNKWEADGLCHNIDCKLHQLESFDLIGFKYVPPSPFAIKNIERRDEEEEYQLKAQFLKPVIYDKDGKFTVIDLISYLKEKETIAELLIRLPKPRSHKNTIFVMHSPPYDTGLDRTFQKKKVGSKAIRRFIEEKRPRLLLCGHIHEAAGIVSLGKTTCVNTGNTSFLSFKIEDEITDLDLT